MTLEVVSWVLAMTLFALWLGAMIGGNDAGGAIHALLVVSVGIAMLHFLKYQRRRD